MPKDTQESVSLAEKSAREHQIILIAERRQRLDAKQHEYAERQRQKRADERAAGVVRPRPKPLRIEVEDDPDMPDLPARRAWSHTAARKPKKKQPVEAAPAAPVKSFQGGAYVTQVGGPQPPEWPKSADELLLDNLDVTPPLFKGFESLIKSRVKCRETAAFLLLRANRQADIANPLFKAATKISNCSKWGLFQSINPAVNYKIGTALCKCRLCPICQRVLSAKRKANFIEWFLLNAKQLRPFFFYHMVLTVRHSDAPGQRNGFYAPDMLVYFSELRGTASSLSGAQQRERSRIWKEFVAGGVYSMEIKGPEHQDLDKSAHIHIHCFLVGRKQLHNAAEDSEFLKWAKPLWKKITGDSDGIFIDKVYYTRPLVGRNGVQLQDERGKPLYERVNAHKGSDPQIEAAAAESMKYTIKADVESLDGLEDSFLIDLLGLRKRYYGRFGCLSANDKDSKVFKKMDMLAADFQDLEKLTDKELARLFDPETGEIIDRDSTSILVAPFKNLVPKAPVPGPLVQRAVCSDWAPGRVKVVGPSRELLGWADQDFKYGGEPYYALKPSGLGENHFFPIIERDRAAVLLSRSISADYGQPYELQEVLDLAAQKGT